jgi:hypothetical protein
VRDSLTEEPGWPRLRRNWSNVLFFALAAAAVAVTLWVGFNVPNGRNDETHFHRHGELGRQEGDHDEFNWELFGIVGTAFGTTLLAFATYVLASSTQTDVRATTALAATAQHTAEREQTPIVLLQRLRVRSWLNQADASGAYHFRYEMELRNVGLGAAVRGMVRLVHEDPRTGTQTSADGRLTSLLAGERSPTVEIEARVSNPPPPGWSPSTGAPSELTVSGVFLDARGDLHHLIDGQPKEPQERVKIVEGALPRTI